MLLNLGSGRHDFRYTLFLRGTFVSLDLKIKSEKFKIKVLATLEYYYL